MQTYSSKFSGKYKFYLIAVSSLLFLSVISISGFADTISSFTNSTVATAPVNNFQVNFTVTGNGTAGPALTNVTVFLQGGIKYVTSTNVTNGTTANYNFTAVNSTWLLWSNTSTGTGTILPSPSGIVQFGFNISAPSSGTYTFLINTTYNYTNSSTGSGNQGSTSTQSIAIINGTVTLTNATFSNYAYNGNTITMNFTSQLSAPTGGGNNENVSTKLYYLGSGGSLVFDNGTCVSAAPCSNTISIANATINGTANTYTLLYITNGTNNYTANSLTATLTISKGVLNLNVSGINVTYPTAVNVGPSKTNTGDTDVNYTFFRNQSANTTAFSSALGANPTNDTTLLAVGWYNYTLNTTAGPFMNWTANTTGVSWNINVSKGTPSTVILINNTYGNTTTTYPTSILNITGNTTSSSTPPSFSLYWVNNTAWGFSLGSSTSGITSTFQFPAGTNQLILNTTGNGNWTSASNSSIYAIVNNGTLTLSINGSNVTYPTAVNITPNENNNSVGTDVVYSFYRNSTLVSSATNANASADTTLLAAGWYNYTLNSTGGANWSSSVGTTWQINVSQATPTITVYLNASTANLTVEEGTFFTVAANSSSTDNTTYAIQIWTNYTGSNATITNTSGQVASSVFNTTNSSVLNLGNYSVYASSNATQNYTASAQSTVVYILVRDTTKPVISSFALTRSSNIYVGDSLNSGAFTCVSSDNNWHTALTTSITGLDTSLPVTKTATCTVTDASGNSASATTQYTVYSGSGFSAPSSSPSTQASVIQTGTTQAYVAGVAAGGVATVSVAQSAQTDVNELDIGFNNQVANIFVDVTKLSTLPSSVSSTPLGTAYSYLTLTVENTQPTDINNATVKFQVNKTWIQVNNIDQNRMYLTRYSNGVWTRLSTTMTSQDSNFVYYQAVTPGFSTFAVAGDQVGAPTPTSTVTPTPTPTPAATQTPAVTPSPTTTSQTTYVLIGLAAVLILGALVIYFQRK